LSALFINGGPGLPEYLSEFFSGIKDSHFFTQASAQGMSATLKELSQHSRAAKVLIGHS
jgi:hypothetical protein